MADATSFRGNLLDTIERQVRFREDKAKEEPGDSRHNRSVSALRRLHVRLADLPGDSPEVFQLCALCDGSGGTAMRAAIVARALDAVRLYGLDGTGGPEAEGEPHSFLRYLAQEFKEAIGY